MLQLNDLLFESKQWVKCYNAGDDALWCVSEIGVQSIPHHKQNEATDKTSNLGKTSLVTCLQSGTARTWERPPTERCRVLRVPEAPQGRQCRKAIKPLMRPDEMSSWFELYCFHPRRTYLTSLGSSCRFQMRIGFGSVSTRLKFTASECVYTRYNIVAVMHSDHTKWKYLLKSGHSKCNFWKSIKLLKLLLDKYG